MKKEYDLEERLLTYTVAIIESMFDVECSMFDVRMNVGTHTISRRGKNNNQRPETFFVPL